MGIRAWTRLHPDPDQAAAAAQTEPRQAPNGKRPKRRHPHEALVFDTETRDEPGQRLMFGVWRLYVDNLDADPATHLVEEGIFYPDDLPDRDPQGWETLCAYVANNRADEVAPGKPRELLLWPATRWLWERLHRYGFKHRNRCSVVGFNLPFDLGALAEHYGPAKPRRGDKGVDYYGGWSLRFASHQGASGEPVDWRYWPRLHMKSIDPRRTLMAWTSVEDDEPYEHAKGAGGGRFVDLRTLAFALTDRSLTLEGACALFGHPYEKQDVEYGVITPEILGYGREDVAATATLYRDCLAELARHPGVDLPPHRLYSPATVGARYLQAMGLAHPLDQFALSDQFLGGCMSAFYGGRAEARIVRTPVPVVVADFTSMYPAQNALLDTWPILTAEHLELDDVTDHVRGLVEAPDLFERLHTKATWAHDIGVTFVEIADIDGAVLPVRARYEPPPSRNPESGSAVSANLGIGINPLHYTGTLTYALPDILAAALLGPPAFRIVHATRLRPVGRQAGLNLVQLRGANTLDPSERDPFLSMVEERHKVLNDPALAKHNRDRQELFLKITANATSYGSLARFDRDEKPNPVTVDAYGPAGVHVTVKTSSPENPGPYCFPPVAASITAGARLTLAMMETHLTRRGGSYAFMDTDSTAIVATPTGGPIPCPGEPNGHLNALSHAQVYDILRAFTDLNPYGSVVVNPDPQLPGSPWKIEKNSAAQPLNAYVVSAKRYLLYREQGTSLELVDPVEDFDAPDLEASYDTENVLSTENLVLADWSEHGIGLYQDPLQSRDDHGRDSQGRRIWIREAWDYILRRALGYEPGPPTWAMRPALTQFTMSSPRQLRWFGHGDSGSPQADVPRPGGFGLMAQAAPASYVEGQPPLPVARFTQDVELWKSLAWRDRTTAAPLRINDADPEQQAEQYTANILDGAIELRTLGTVLNRYQLRTEHKSLAPDATPAAAETKGRLRRRAVFSHPTATQLIGKESNKLAERVLGSDGSTGADVTAYGAIDDYWTRVIVPILRDMGAPLVAEATGTSTRRVRDWLNGGARPHAGPSGHMQRAIRAAEAHARARDQG